MATKIKINDLGAYKDPFEKILQKYRLQDKADALLALLIDLVMEKIDEPAALNVLWDDLKINSIVATDLIYDIDGVFLKDKKKLDDLRHVLEKKYLVAFSPELIADEFLEKLDYTIKDKTLKKKV